MPEERTDRQRIVSLVKAKEAERALDLLSEIARVYIAHIEACGVPATLRLQYPSDDCRGRVMMTLYPDRNELAVEEPNLPSLN